MSWNYRVVHHRLTQANVLPDGRVLPEEPAEIDRYEIHEVYYDDAGRVETMTVAPMPVSAEDVEGVRWMLDKMREALDKPVLEYDVEKLRDDPQPEETNDHDVA